MPLSLQVNPFFLVDLLSNNPEIDGVLLALFIGTTLDYVNCVRKMCLEKMFFWLIDGICWFYVAIRRQSNSRLQSADEHENKPSKLFKILIFFSNGKITEKIVSWYVRGDNVIWNW